MEDTWRKAKHFGLGVLDFTREKVEALVNDSESRRGRYPSRTPAEAVADIGGKGQIQEQEAFLDMLRGVVEKNRRRAWPGPPF